MKKLLYSILFILAIAGHSYGDTVVDGVNGGGGVSEGSDVGFGNITATSITATTVTGTTSITGGWLQVNMGGGNARIATIASKDMQLLLVGGGGELLLDYFGNHYLTSKLSSTSGTDAAFSILSNHSTTGTAGGADFTIVRTDASTGSGEQNYIKATGGSGDFRVDTTGSITATSIQVTGVAFSGISSIAADYVMGNFATDSTFFISCDAALGNVSTTLPPLADKKGRLVEMKLISATNGCYFDGNGAETIDGVAGQAITTEDNVISLIAGATEWSIR